jgi:elongation factor Tu
MDSVEVTFQHLRQETDKPFYLRRRLLSITGRGTVATGRVERGSLKVGENVEIVGFKTQNQCGCTGLETFKNIR